MSMNEDRLEILFDELVPTFGKCDSLAGELVRAVNRVGYRFFNDGDMLNYGYGKETCNPAGRFLVKYGDAQIAELVSALWKMSGTSEKAYEIVLELLLGAVADYVEKTPSLRDTETVDMFSCRDKDEDVDDSWEEDEDYWEDEEDEEEYED